jgi:hypothetical protein
VIVKVHQASGVVSPYFQLRETPGTRVRAGTLELVNLGRSPATVRLDPVDAMTTSTLGSAYRDTGSPLHGASTWLRLPIRRVTVPPHADRSVPVAVAVPANADGGDYLTGIAVEALGQDETSRLSHGLAIGETIRYAVGVEMQLTGPRRPAVALTNASVTREPSGVAFLVDAANTGNVILKGVHGHIVVRRGRRVVARTVVAPGTFVSHTAIAYPVLGGHEDPTPGTSYHVEAELDYPGGVARLSRTVVFSHAAAVVQEDFGGRKLPRPVLSVGWPVVGGAAFGVLALLAGFGGLAVRRRRLPRGREHAMPRLQQLVGAGGQLPVSVMLIVAPADIPAARLAAIARPALRRSDRAYAMRRGELLVVCPATSRPAVLALREAIEARLAARREVADRPVYVVVSTAVKPTTAAKLLDRLGVNRRRQARETVAV